jgi:hypothetical protein
LVVSTNIRQQKNTSSSLQGVGAKENFFKKEKKTKLQVIKNQETTNIAEQNGIGNESVKFEYYK